MRQDSGFLEEPAQEGVAGRGSRGRQSLEEPWGKGPRCGSNEVHPGAAACYSRDLGVWNSAEADPIPALSTWPRGL